MKSHCLLIFFCTVFISILSLSAGEWLLFQTTPANRNQWGSEYFPLGNGALGAMLSGGIEEDVLQLNLDSLWSGDMNLERGARSMGRYQSLGELRILLEKAPRQPDFYRRELDLARALHTVVIKAGGTSQIRTAYISAPDQVLVYSIFSSQPLTGRIVLEDSRQGMVYHENGISKRLGTRYEGQDILLDGLLPRQLKYLDAAKQWREMKFGVTSGDMLYAVRIRVSGDGVVASEEKALRFRDCRKLTLLLVGDTTYEQNPASKFRNPDKLKRLPERLVKAAAAGESELRKRHIADYRQYFDRVSLNLGSGRNELPLTKRLAEFRKNGGDPALQALLFQYGRYLLISSSRPGTLPANLQGIWNNSNTPPWNSDFHTNINLQMNYWGAEPANLAECHLPLFHLMNASIPAAEQDTQSIDKKHPPEGFTFRTSLNPFGGGEWKWNYPSAAWLALHMFSHYEYNPDEIFLRQIAWPYFEGCMKFWLSYLKERPDGIVVVPRGWSPEHGPVEDGVSYDQQIVTEFFDVFLESARILRIQNNMIRKAAAIRPRLLGPKIGNWGQLQEWETDRDRKGDTHRHTSHLFAVYPGNAINAATPDLLCAARISLEGRATTGDSRRSWTWPWRCALWARLGNGTRATEMLFSLLRCNTMNNLFTTHPPFQIDGNLGIIGAICEMLLQNETDRIFILPVDLPEWPDGSFSGLRAKGGYTIGAEWANGIITRAEIKASRPGILKLRFRTPLQYDGRSARTFAIPVKAGQIILLNR